MSDLPKFTNSSTAFAEDYAATISRWAIFARRAIIAAALSCKIFARASSPICASASALLVPLAAEFGAVGAAHDVLGAVQAHLRLDRARAASLGKLTIKLNGDLTSLSCLLST